MTHAIEGYTTLASWELADTLNLKAIEIISRSLRKAVENDPKGREDMALGQYMTGMAFSNVGLGVVHGMAHPLSAFYNTPHGVANAVLLPYVMEFNAPYTGEKFREIARAMGVKGVDKMSQEEYRRAAIDAVKQLKKDVNIPETGQHIFIEFDFIFFKQADNRTSHKKFADFHTFRKTFVIIFIVIHADIFVLARSDNSGPNGRNTADNSCSNQNYCHFTD